MAPLEGLWWAEDMAKFSAEDKGNWLWTAMIMQPDWIGDGMIAAAPEKAKGKLGEPPASLRLEIFEEGLSVQTMHIGPYSAEAPTIAKLHAEFLPANGLAESGHHHEIYLSDPGRTAPEKLKTVIRQPVRRGLAAEQLPPGGVALDHGRRRRIGDEQADRGALQGLCCSTSQVQLRLLACLPRLHARVSSHAQFGDDCRGSQPDAGHQLQAC